MAVPVASSELAGRGKAALAGVELVGRPALEGTVSFGWVAPSGPMHDELPAPARLRQLKTAASGLGLPDFFDDLRPTSPQDLLAARLR